MISVNRARSYFIKRYALVALLAIGVPASLMATTHIGGQYNCNPDGPCYHLCLAVNQANQNEDDAADAWNDARRNERKECGEAKRAREGYNEECSFNFNPVSILLCNWLEDQVEEAEQECEDAEAASDKALDNWIAAMGLANDAYDDFIECVKENAP